MTTAITSSQNKFAVSSAIIKQLITSQSGTLTKAILELVSNSMDAGASEVFISLSPELDKVTVTDNGCGFESLDEVEGLFGTFGFDHQSDVEIARNRSYGRFGLGRGQALSFGSCVWTSNQFSMSCDLNKNSTQDIFYDLKEHSHCIHKGCKVEIELYENLSIRDLHNLKTTLQNQLKYVATPILINGDSAVKHPDQVSWTTVDQGVSFIKSSGDSTSGLCIFNQGVYVMTVSHQKFGVSGDVTTNEPLLLNMARNEVLFSRCPVWDKVKKVIGPHAAVKKKKALNYHDANYRLSAWLGGEIETKDIYNQDLFLNILGRRNRLQYVQSFADYRITASATDFSQVAENVHRDRLAYVLSPKQIGDLGFSDIGELVTAINSRLSGPYSGLHSKSRNFRAVDFLGLAKNYSGNCRVLADSRISKVAKLRLKALSGVNNDLVYMVNSALGNHWGDGIRARKLVIGESQTASAWTDSATYIAINKTDFSSAFENGSIGLTRLLGILVHEYCHNVDSSNDHAHGIEFYSNFHDVILSAYYKPNNLVTNLIKKLVSLRKKADIPIALCEVEHATDNSIAKLVVDR